MTIAALVLLAWLAALTQQPAAWKAPRQPVYVVAVNHAAQGYTPQASKFGELLMVQIYPKQPVYQTGKTFPLYIDGRRTGDVRIQAIKQHHCEGTAALVVPTAGRLPDNVLGIATNAAGIQDRPGDPAMVSDAERASAVQAVIREFRRNNVAASLMTRVRIEKLAAVQADAVEEKAIAGSFFVQTSTERHDVFFIARVVAGKVSLEYSRYRQTTDLADFKDHDFIGVIGHLDVTGNGLDEIVINRHGYESESYDIFSRDSGRWQFVATGGEAGC